jgi:hypothetical protein
MRKKKMRLPDHEVREATISVLEAALQAAQDQSSTLPFEWLPEGDVGAHMVRTSLVHPEDGREFFATVVAFVSSDKRKLDAISRAWTLIAGFRLD